MKIKVGDMVIPKHLLGKIVSIDEQQVVIEWTDPKGIVRRSSFTKKQAERHGKTLDQHVDDSLMIV